MFLQVPKAPHTIVVLGPYTFPIVAFDQFNYGIVCDENDNDNTFDVCRL